MDGAIQELATSQRYPFEGWPVQDVPNAPGVYSIWRGQDFIYVGMAGRPGSAGVASIEAGRRLSGLRARLDSHASGRRSGDQFCIYVCDRLVLPTLRPAQIHEVAQGRLSLDKLTRDLVRSAMTFTFTITADGRTALSIERLIKLNGLPTIGRPLLNPGLLPD